MIDDKPFFFLKKRGKREDRENEGGKERCLKEERSVNMLAFG